MIPWFLATAIMIGGVLLLMGLGLPVAVAFLGINILGAWVFLGGTPGIDQLIANTTDSVTSFALVPVPLFILMGELLFQSGMALRVFDALDKCMGRSRGRLSYMTVAGGTLFATLSGSSMANTAMLGTTLMPEMKRRGYKDALVMGPILATGSLAMIIPPSSLAVLLGSLARIDVGALLIAGVIPGLILAALFVVTIRLLIAFDPEAAPGYDAERAPLGVILRAVARDVLPMGLVIFSVVGLILLGLATPTESAAFGVLSVVVLALFYGKLDRGVIFRSLRGTVSVSVMTLTIILASTTFAQILAFSGASRGVVAWATSFDAGAMTMLACIFLVLLVMGMFMDQLSIMMLTIPVFMPLVAHFQFDPVWFGVFMLVALEMSLVTPPFGLLLFVMLGVAPKGTTLAQVTRSVIPYLACTVVLLLLLVAFPGLATWLPSLN